MLSQSVFEGAEPYIGMPIEIRDDQFIWSSAIIHQVNTFDCIIRYDGWGAEWDVLAPWRNNPRLAQIGTFTKRALCYVNLSSSTTLKGLWPCVVNIRMPDPRCDEDTSDLAANELRAERKVFVQPYGEDLLPKHISSTKMMYGGIWIDRSRVKEWKDIQEIPSKDTISTHFRRAYDLAVADKDVIFTMPKDVFERSGGSLVKQDYRVVLESQGAY